MLCWHHFPSKLILSHIGKFSDKEKPIVCQRKNKVIWQNSVTLGRKKALPWRHVMNVCGCKLGFSKEWGTGWGLLHYPSPVFMKAAAIECLGDLPLMARPTCPAVVGRREWEITGHRGGMIQAYVLWKQSWNIYSIGGACWYYALWLWHIPASWQRKLYYMLSLSLDWWKIESESLFPFPDPYLPQVCFLPTPPAAISYVIFGLVSLSCARRRCSRSRQSLARREERGWITPATAGSGARSRRSSGTTAQRGGAPPPRVTSQPSARCGRAAGSPPSHSAANGSAGRVPAQPMGARGVWRRRDGGGAVLAGRAARGEAETVSDGARAGRGGRGTPGAASPPPPLPLPLPQLCGGRPGPGRGDGAPARATWEWQAASCPSGCVPAYGRGVGITWSFRSLPTQTVPWFLWSPVVRLSALVQLLPGGWPWVFPILRPALDRAGSSGPPCPVSRGGGRGHGGLDPRRWLSPCVTASCVLCPHAQRRDVGTSGAVRGPLSIPCPWDIPGPWEPPVSPGGRVPVLLWRQCLCEGRSWNTFVCPLVKGPKSPGAFPQVGK